MGRGEKDRMNIQGTGKNFQKGSKTLGLACWTISGNCVEAVGPVAGERSIRPDGKS